MLDTSCTGSFMKKTIEFRWDLLEKFNATLKIGSSTKRMKKIVIENSEEAPCRYWTYS
jgi:hypothetical protein